ncbi:hypothetical protein [Actinomadura parmotrematis]|uniref:CbrC family protein n=1 Tax=Actinomadura parmotrematis TaxID=2864039 RepID=A0ABS7FZN8_9ACTN|nr:hypothetical protein [Actinomadura parmotrematis]MBW8485079.1 hypothetical protein [Actinomadura parmotrematis]
MGDYFVAVVDVEATPRDAERLAADVRAWLVAEGVVAAERTECVIGSATGHAPGPRAGEAVDGSGRDGSWRDLWHNGVDVRAGHRVHDAGQGDPTGVACPHCAHEIDLMDDGYELDHEAWAPFAAVVHGWDEGREVVLDCPSCGRPVEPTAWKWTDDYFVLAHLGVTFWNWPPLRPAFLAGLARRLGGHRVTVLEGKL